MDTSFTSQAFAALAQDTRLKVFQVLIEYGSKGLPAGEISSRLDIPHNTLSFHLSHLKQAGLVSCKRQGRSVIYAANTEIIQGMIDFLQSNCCIHEDGPKSACAVPEKFQCDA